MSRFFTCFFTATILGFTSCQTDGGHTLSTPETKPAAAPVASKAEVVAVNPESLLKNFMTWYSYAYKNVRLAEDFAGLAPDSTQLTRAAFIRQLQTGKYMAIHTGYAGQQKVFKLFPLPASQNNIAEVIRQQADTEAAHMAMEGKQLPSYSFTDIAGKRYDAATTKGKTMLLKCWFIHCVACVKEFPVLNKLVNEYDGRDDVLFVSLASDKKEELVSFLEKRPFRYAVVPLQGDYMRSKLGVMAYPTHLLVNKEGRIVKVTNTIEDMGPFLRKETANHL